MHKTGNADFEAECHKIHRLRFICIRTGFESLGDNETTWDWNAEKRSDGTQSRRIAAFKLAKRGKGSCEGV